MNFIEYCKKREGDLVNSKLDDDDLIDFDRLQKYLKEYESYNAKLIAAAPKLLSALQEMIKMYESVQPCGGWQGQYEDSILAVKKALN